MVRDVSGSDERLRKEHMDLIISEAHRMSAMVDDIMDFSIMQAGYTQLKMKFGIHTRWFLRRCLRKRDRQSI